MEKKKVVKRVLITSIGGGKTEDKDGVKILKKYEDTIYGIKKENGEFHMEKTSYMPLIIENTYDIDKTIIIGTTGSMWDNLYDIYWKKFKQDKIKDEKFKQSLIDVQVTSNRETPIDKINIDSIFIFFFNQEFIGKVKGIVIKYGVSSKEISRNFDLIIKLQEEFNDTDEYEVFLDITHSFRSMAFWMFLIMNYLTDVSNKNIKIAGITYGMFEAKKDNITPIVILKPFLEILNWIKGASELKQYGNSYYILEKSDNNSLAKSIKDELRNFSNTMNMNYINSLLESIKNLKKLDTENELDKINGPAKHIIPNILKEFIKDFDLKEDDDIEFKLRKQQYLLSLDFDIVKNTKKQKVYDEYLNFYISQQDILYKKLLKQYSMKMTEKVDINRKIELYDKIFERFLFKANEIHLWFFPCCEIYHHKGALHRITRTSHTPGVEYGHIPLLLAEGDVRMSINSNICPCLTRSRGEYRCIKPHMEEMPMREKDTMPAGLDDGLAIRSIQRQIAVAEDAHNALPRQLFQCICIGGIISCMKPHLCLCRLRIL